MGIEVLNRREFMVKTGLGLMTAGVGIGPVRAFGAETVTEPKIIYRTLGRTNLKIPVVSFGVMNSDSPDLIRKAIDMGIKHLDTAYVYLRGNSETVIGKILEERGCRNKVYIATKAVFSRDDEKRIFLSEDHGRYLGATEENLNKLLTTSLKRLRTDYVDILYLHNCYGPHMVTYDPIMEAYAKVKESGKARFLGITTHKDEPETIRAAVDAGIWDVVLTSYNFMQKHRDEVKKAIGYAAEKGVGVIAMKTLGGARLSEGKKEEINHAAALKWVLNDKNVCTSIPGITTYDQMDLDFGVMADLTLSGEEKRDLAMSSMVKGPLYCQQCGSCLSSCAKKVEIPTLMRAYMYAEGYDNLLNAELALDELAIGRGLDVCQDCTNCTASCINGIRIRDRLEFLMAMNALGSGRA